MSKAQDNYFTIKLTANAVEALLAQLPEQGRIALATATVAEVARRRLDLFKLDTYADLEDFIHTFMREELVREFGCEFQTMFGKERVVLAADQKEKLRDFIRSVAVGEIEHTRLEFRSMITAMMDEELAKWKARLAPEVTRMANEIMQQWLSNMVTKEIQAGIERAIAQISAGGGDAA